MTIKKSSLRRYYKCPAELFDENVRPASNKIHVKYEFGCEDCINVDKCDGPVIVKRNDAYIAAIFASLYEQGVPLKFLTKAYGLENRQSINEMLRSQGVKMLSPSESRLEGQKWEYLAKNEKYIKQLYLLGIPTKILAAGYDTDERNIRFILNRAGVLMSRSEQTRNARQYYKTLRGGN